MYQSSALFVLAVLFTAPHVKAEDSVRNIGSRLELFVDHYLIERMEGARLKLHEPRREEVVFNTDGYVGYTTVIKDRESYRLYYSWRDPQRTDDDDERPSFPEGKEDVVTRRNTGQVRPTTGRLFASSGMTVCTIQTSIIAESARP